MLRRHQFVPLLCALAAVSLTCAPMVGCQPKKVRPSKVIKPLYDTLPAKNVPVVFKDTIMARCDLLYTEPFLVSGYGLVVNLDNTGSSVAPNLVREYIHDLMVKRKFGSSLSGVPTPSPEAALRDPRVAIVQVDG